MTTKQQVDVEKLHQIFNKESCENDERNLLFVWTLIGIAQLNCFSFLKIKKIAFGYLMKDLKLLYYN